MTDFKRFIGIDWSGARMTSSNDSLPAWEKVVVHPHLAFGLSKAFFNLPASTSDRCQFVYGSRGGFGPPGRQHHILPYFADLKPRMIIGFW